jgi:general stress protein 26
MPTPQELEAKFWKALDADRTVMLGLVGDGALRPMAAQLEDDRSTIWFFTSTETALARGLVASQGAGANLAFVSKGHDLYANIRGRLSRDTDRAAVDRLWNRYVAAWFEGGKDDPKLVLLRFVPEHGEIWEDASSVLAGIKMLLGGDPKADAQDKVAKVSFQ